jgi:hypothetical protein
VVRGGDCPCWDVEAGGCSVVGGVASCFIHLCLGLLDIRIQRARAWEARPAPVRGVSHGVCSAMHKRRRQPMIHQQSHFGSIREKLDGGGYSAAAASTPAGEGSIGMSQLLAGAEQRPHRALVESFFWLLEHAPQPEPSWCRASATRLDAETGFMSQRRSAASPRTPDATAALRSSRAMGTAASQSADGIQRWPGLL